MAISDEDVKYLAHLARITLSKEELTHFQAQLESILGYIDQLNSVDVSGIAPTAHVLDLSNVLREDELRPSLDLTEFLKTAPSRQGNFFKVPKVIE